MGCWERGIVLGSQVRSCGGLIEGDILKRGVRFSNLDFLFPFSFSLFRFSGLFGGEIGRIVGWF